MSRIICFDIETTGFEYMRGDRCIEIGAVEIIDGKITDNTFHEYINPEGKIIPPETYMVHKISNAFLDDKPKMSVVAPRFLEFIGDSPVVAHNGLDFDFPFVNHELEMLGLAPIPRNQQMDTLVIARNRVFGPKSCKALVLPLLLLQGIVLGLEGLLDGLQTGKCFLQLGCEHSDLICQCCVLLVGRLELIHEVEYNLVLRHLCEYKGTKKC